MHGSQNLPQTNVAYYLDEERETKRNEAVCLHAYKGIDHNYRLSAASYEVKVTDVPLVCGYDPDDNKDKPHSRQDGAYPCICVC